MPKVTGITNLGEKVNVVDNQHLNAIRFGGAQDRATFARKSFPRHTLTGSHKAQESWTAINAE
jgi:hypothetical protein